MNRSLLWLLSAWICGAILAVGLVAAALSFWFAFDETRDLQDDELREIAWLVSPGDAPFLSSQGGGLQAEEPDMRIWVLRIAAHDAGTETPDRALMVPAALSDGLHTIDSQGESWRVYVRTMHGERRAVAQRTSARDAIARDSALRTLVPLLVLIPVLIVLAALLIRILLAKVHAVAAEVDKKGDADLAPLAIDSAPAEILPFVAATNRLLARLQAAFAQQRRFVADAAHELRSPVTAMTLQLENALSGEATPPAAREQLAPLGASVARMRALVAQLLRLAEQEAKPPTMRREIDVKAVLVELFGELFPLADAKAVDLGLEADGGLKIPGGEHDFRALARNAIDNAVRYAPPGGKVDVRLYRRGAKAIFEVEDSGPGIPESELARVFDPFYRVVGSGQPGSGLGLTIVRSAAERLGGRVSLHNTTAPDRTGLLFVYRQTAAPA